MNIALTFFPLYKRKMLSLAILTCTQAQVCSYVNNRFFGNVSAEALRHGDVTVGR